MGVDTVLIVLIHSASGGTNCPLLILRPVVEVDLIQFRPLLLIVVPQVFTPLLTVLAMRNSVWIESGLHPEVMNSRSLYHRLYTLFRSKHGR